MTVTRQKIALVHVAKARLSMADDSYRALLKRAAGVASAADLDDLGFEEVMAEFERVGFQRGRGRLFNARRDGMATPAQIGKIRALWTQYTGRHDDLRLGHWLEKHFHVSNVRFLDAAAAGKVIAILLKMTGHAAVKTGAEKCHGGEV
jgi:phage gp16-like protein